MIVFKRSYEKAPTGKHVLAVRPIVLLADDIGDPASVEVLLHYYIHESHQEEKSELDAVPGYPLD